MSLSAHGAAAGFALFEALAPHRQEAYGGYSPLRIASRWSRYYTNWLAYATEHRIHLPIVD